MAFEVNKTELIWPGKYDNEGNLVQPSRVSLPFQVIERVNETRATREAKKAEGLTLFDVWDGSKEGSSFEDGWRNKLIWGDNALVMSSLLADFSGKIKLVYIDPPFDVGADFSVEVQIGDEEVGKAASVMEEVAYRDTWGKGAESFLAMMFERLRLIHQLLADDGALYLHVDWRMAGHMRVLLDEIFGSTNFRNEVIWYYSGGGASKEQWARKHDNIFFVTKGSKWTFNVDAVRQAYKWTDGQKRADGSGRDLEKGKIPDDVFDLHGVMPWAGEKTGYPTQKPEELLSRLIKASSNEGDLVADLFIGSGTTAAVAEKLGRRWIGADLGRFAIHTTRKRLLGIDKCKPFEVLNLGKYERQFWSTSNFGEDLDGDGRVSLLDYIAFILKAYGAEPIAGSSHLHGKKGDAYVHVGSVSSPITNADINAAAQECQNLKGKKVHILGWEWEMGLHDPVVGLLKKELGIEVVLRQIPNEIMEAEAVRKGQIKFFDLAYASVAVEPKGKLGEYICTLQDFSTPNSDLVPEEVRREIKKWSDYVDYWAIDWNFQNDTFKHDWVTYRTRQDRSLALKSDPHRFDKPGTYQVLVKVIDIFGNDTSTIVEVTVK